MSDGVRVNARLVIPMDELEFRASRSSGPGGQGVNTTSSRIELRWDVASSRAPDPAQRALLLERLGHRLTDDGVLILHGSEHRSQHRNRDAVIARLRAIVGEAVVPPTPRRPTRPTRASIARRLDDKRARSRTKDLRQSTED
jgi:ribosome-associated protein